MKNIYFFIFHKKENREKGGEGIKRWKKIGDNEDNDISNIKNKTQCSFVPSDRLISYAVIYVLRNAFFMTTRGTVNAATRTVIIFLGEV